MIPVFNSEQETALLLIIKDLISGLSKLKKEERERILDKELLAMFAAEFQSGDLGYGDIGSIHGQEKHKGKRSMGNDYNKEMPNTSPLVFIADKFRDYYKTYSSRGTNFADLVSSFEENFLREHVSFNENRAIVDKQKTVIEELETEITDLRKQIKNEKYQKDKIYGDMNGMIKRLQDSLPQEQYKSVVYESVYTVSEEVGMTETIVDKYTSTIAGTEYQRGGSIAHTEAIAEKERKISEIYQQLSVYESQNFEERRKITQLERENELLKEDLRVVQSGIPQS